MAGGVLKRKREEEEEEGGLPAGWRREKRRRRDGSKADFYLITDNGKQFRSQVEVDKYLMKNNMKFEVKLKAIDMSDVEETFKQASELQVKKLNKDFPIAPVVVATAPSKDLKANVKELEVEVRKLQVEKASLSLQLLKEREKVARVGAEAEEARQRLRLANLASTRLEEENSGLLRRLEEEGRARRKLEDRLIDSTSSTEEGSSRANIVTSLLEERQAGQLEVVGLLARGRAEVGRRGAVVARAITRAARRDSKA